MTTFVIAWTTPPRAQLLWFVVLSRQRELRLINSAIPPASLYCRLRNSYVVMSKWKTLLPQKIVRCLITGSFWCPPQHTRWPPHCCRLSRLLYTCWRKAFNCVHTLSFQHRGAHVFRTRITDTCLYDHYTDSYMTQRFHTSRWKILHLSFCTQVFST